MRIKCPECNTEYKINPEKIPIDGTISKCKKCGNFIEIEHPNAAKDGKKRESIIQDQEATQRGQIGESKTISKKGKKLGIGILIFGFLINLVIYFYTKAAFSPLTLHLEDSSWLLHYIPRFGGILILCTSVIFFLIIVFYHDNLPRE